jgi:hypothetical protein
LTENWLLKQSSVSHTNLLSELRLDLGDWFNNYLKIDEATHLEFLQKIIPRIEKSDTVMREAVTPHERLCVTLRFLATGKNCKDLKFSPVISPQALGVIIPEQYMRS